MRSKENFGKKEAVETEKGANPVLAIN